MANTAHDIWKNILKRVWEASGFIYEEDEIEALFWTNMLEYEKIMEIANYIRNGLLKECTDYNPSYLKAKDELDKEYEEKVAELKTRLFVEFSKTEKFTEILENEIEKIRP